MEKLILGLIAAIAMFGGMSAASEAKTNFTLYLGVPYYDYKAGPGYLFDENHGWYQPASHTGAGRPKLVCLVTFFKRDQVKAGADANVKRAQLLPRRVALRYDRPNDRNRIFDYGNNRKTRETCQYLANLDNQQQSESQEVVCLVTFFSRDQVGGGADADVQRARVLPRRIAEERDAPDDRNRIFVYGSNQKTRETCQYLADLDNQQASDNQDQEQELVCLVTFLSRNQVSGGADADVQRAKVLPRNVAEERDAPDDRNRVFAYGSNQKTRETCKYLDGINN